MSRNLNLVDRARIEWTVWGLDQRLYDIPRRSRIDRRRELRANLTEAARDVGASQALRELGSTTALAEEYRTAELGPGPRHSWIAAAIFVFTTTLIMNSVLFEAAQAFGDGILAGNPSASGTFTWHGAAFVQSKVTFTVADGGFTQVGGGFSPGGWLLLAVGAIAVGRLWRAVPRLRRQPATA